MKTNILLLTISLYLVQIAFSQHSKTPLKSIFNQEKVIDFDSCYFSRTPIDIILKGYPIAKNYLRVFKKIYEDNFVRDYGVVQQAEVQQSQKLENVTKLNEEYKIPKKIHVFWNGNRPSRALTDIYARSCRDMNPGWEFKIWNLKEVLELPTINKEFLDNNEKNLERSNLKDYALLNVLKVHGGIFLDMDYICLRPFDDIAKRYKYFSTLEPPFDWAKVPATSFSMIGSEKNGSIVNDIIPKFEKYFSENEYAASINKQFSKEEQNYSVTHLVQFTIGQSVYEQCRDDQSFEINCKEIMLFPSCYFLQPFLRKGEFLGNIRALYPGVVQLLTYCYSNIYPGSSVTQMEEKYPILDVIVWFIENFLPLIKEEYAFEKPNPDTVIAFQDWHEGNNGIIIADQFAGR